MSSTRRSHPHPRLRNAAVRFLIAALLLLVAALTTHMTIFAVLCTICAMACLWLWVASMKDAKTGTGDRRG